MFGLEADHHNNRDARGQASDGCVLNPDPRLRLSRNPCGAVTFAIAWVAMRFSRCKKSLRHRHSCEGCAPRDTAW